MKKQDCASCGAQNGMQHFEARGFSVDFKQLNREVRDLSGRQCQVCNEIEFDPRSAERYSEASDQLIEDSKRVMADEMKRIRRKLHFTQRTAVQLLSGGGHNAFSRYERAEIEPPKPLFILPLGMGNVTFSSTPGKGRTLRAPSSFRRSITACTKTSGADAPAVTPIRFLPSSQAGLIWPDLRPASDFARCAAPAR